MNRLLEEKEEKQKGATAIMVAIVLAALMGFSALAIDVGYLYATRNELQNVADAAALAAATKLGSIYLEQAPQDHNDYDMLPHEGEIKTSAGTVALKNNAAGKAISILDGDIHIGKWNWEEHTLEPGLIGATAVQVIARRDAQANNPVETFFAKIFTLFGGNHDTFDASAVATAALSGPASMDEGELNMPFGISQTVFEDVEGKTYCGDIIEFKDTKDSCVGWHNFFDKPGGSGSKMDEKFLNFVMGYGMDISGEKSVPTGYDNSISGSQWLQDNFTIDTNSGLEAETIAKTTAYEDEYYFTGGTVASLLPNSTSNDYLKWDETKTYAADYKADYNDMKLPYTADYHTSMGKDPAPFRTLFDFFRFVDGDGDPWIWTATVPVYQDTGTCDNPSGFTPITGYARIEISKVNPPPDTNITVKISCDMVVVPGLSGGGQYGNILGSIPNLVE